MPISWKCDFEADCFDGSDEANCSGYHGFICGDGSEIVGYFQCDDYPDCSDGSDEIGCAELTCG